jgi:hypothetical protein
VAATGGIGNRGLAGGGLTIPSSKGGGPEAGGGMLPGAGATPGADPFGAALRDGAFKGDGTNLGGQKGSAGLGSGSGSSGGNAGGSGAYGSNGSGDPNDRTKVNSGFYGGAAAGTSYFGTNGAGGANGLAGRANTGGVNYNKVGGSQFDPRRYIAGLNGKGGEFINGPGIDIFKIVKNRIEAKKPSMLDPDFKK